MGGGSPFTPPKPPDPQIREGRGEGLGRSFPPPCPPRAPSRWFRPLRASLPIVRRGGGAGGFGGDFGGGG